MTSFTVYHWCLVPGCNNTSVKTPHKLWIQVPSDIILRNTWLKLARRDPKSMSTKTRLYFCEDHFDLENDMENYTQYKIMGSVKRIRMKPNCIPSRFDCHADRKHKSTPSEPHAFVKRQRMSTIKDIEETGESEDHDVSLPSCSQDLMTPEIKKCHDKAVQAIQPQGHKAIQVCRMIHYRSRSVQTNIKKEDSMTSPFKTTVCTATSPFKVSQGTLSKLCASNLSGTKRKLSFFETKYDSDESYTPSIAGSTVDYDSSSYKICQSKTTSDDSSQEELKKVEKLNLQSTLYKIKCKPRLYIGLPNELYFLIDLIKKYTNISEHNILLCLMRIKLNRTFAQLADDFDISVTQASNVFFNTMPEIVKVLSPFIRQFSIDTIKKNLPIAFRHKYNKVTCIIDCLEIEIQKPKKAMHQALTWSDYKKTNTIKYLISCTPDGLVNFVSTGYGGRISDVNLVEHSKFLDSLPSNACILADRGFKHLEYFLSQKGFTLLRPPSVSAGSKLTKTEVRQTKQLASLRIHVERVIRRLREFGMLKMHSVINSNLIGMLDLCITTACALINLQDALIK